MCYSSAKIFFPHPNRLPCASPGAQHPALETAGPEDVPRKIFSSLLSLLPSSPSANNPLSFFPFTLFPTCASSSSEVRLAGTGAFGGASWGEAAPHLHPILWLCHGPNSVLILLAPVNTKNRFVACCLHCWGVQAGAGCDCLAGTEAQAGAGAGRAGVWPFKPGDPCPAAAWGAWCIVEWDRY